MFKTLENGQSFSLGREAERDRQISAVFGLMVVAMIVLQKFGLNVGDGAVGLNVAVLWLGIGVLALRGHVEIGTTRLMLLILVLNAIMLNFVLHGQMPKLSALAILLAMYAGFVIRMRISHALAMRCIGHFQTCMAVIAVVVLAQQVVQYTIGNRFWPNLDAIVPAPLLYGGFAYLHPYKWNSPLLEPNGIVFLEPSALSGYLAMAVALEVTCFFRVKRLLLYVAAMLACLAGTGPTTLLLTLPFWARRLDRRVVAVMLLVGLPFIAIAYGAGWFDPLLARSGELSDSKSSGFTRIMLPLAAIRDQLQDWSSLLMGSGPGTSVRGANLVQWPFSKLLVEYGLLTAVLFHIYILVCVLQNSPVRAALSVILVPYLFFGGGFVSHATVMPLFLLGSLLAIDSAPITWRGRWKPSAAQAENPNGGREMVVGSMQMESCHKESSRIRLDTQALDAPG